LGFEVYHFGGWARKYFVKVLLHNTMLQCIQRVLIISWNRVYASEYGITISDDSDNKDDNTRFVVWGLKCLSVW
jgi:hypothetical protein